MAMAMAMAWQWHGNSGYGNMVSLLELLNKWSLKKERICKRDCGDFIGNNILCGRGRVLKKGGYENWNIDDFAES